MDGTGWRDEGKEGVKRKQEGERKATVKEEFRFPRFSNKVTPRGRQMGWRDCAIILRRMDAPGHTCIRRFLRILSKK
jgi:hypothetical protein